MVRPDVAHSVPETCSVSKFRYIFEQIQYAGVTQDKKKKLALIQHLTSDIKLPGAW